MSLTDWLDSGWISAHTTSPEEIADLLSICDRDLADSNTKGLSADWRLNIAYNAALQAATAALAAAGYRASRDMHHYRIIHSLQYTIGADVRLINQLEAFRKKRNIGGYERAGGVSDVEAREILALARKLRKEVEGWIRKTNAGLLSKK